MKRMWIIMMVLLLGAMTALAGKTMSVQVKNGQIRSAPNYFGQVIAQVAYGDKVTVEQEQSGWMRVTTAAGVSGWMNNSALSTHTVALVAGDKDVKTGASGQELALAGKGFSKEVEADYKKKNRHLDYQWVDYMEKIVILDSEKAAFLKEGGLQLGGAQ